MTKTARRYTPRIALLLAAATLAAGAAQAAPQRLVVSVTLPGGTIGCSARDAAISRTPPLRLDFDCASGGTRFRCDLDGTAGYAVQSTLITAPCFAITEVPRGDPADLVFAAGHEG